jgi:hypothetical protein
MAAAIVMMVLPVCAFSQSYTLTQGENGPLLKTPDGRTVFQYMESKPAGSPLTAPSTACFHPVYTPGGQRITNLAPNDHPHHRGIWLGWQDSEFHEPLDVEKMGANHPVRAMRITRADFWGWGVYAPREGRVIVTKEFKLVNADAKHAELEIHNDWDVDDRKMADESDTVVVSERDGVFVMDFTYNITPIADFLLMQSGFGGFALQARKDGPSVFTTPEGKMTGPDPYYGYPDTDRPDELWWDYAITPQESGKMIGAAVINSPLNPPTWWHNATFLWMLNPAITSRNGYTIPAKTTLTLRYRVITHDGAPPAALLDKLANEFRRH